MFQAAKALSLEMLYSAIERLNVKEGVDVLANELIGELTKQSFIGC
jgi:hypothetical protein